MMKSLKSLGFLVGIAALNLVGAPASAATYRLQPAFGMPFLTSAITGWNTVNSQAAYSVLDGRSVIVAPTTTGAWVTPIPVDTTGVSWFVRQFVNSGSGTVETRICSFTKEGVFSNCSTTTASSNVARSVTVPSDGTAFAQTFFTGQTCRDNCANMELHTIRASNTN